VPERLSRSGIDVIFLVPHSSDQTQLLDLITLALLKRGFSSSKFSRLAKWQSSEVTGILGMWFAPNAPHNNIQAFMETGLIPMEPNGDFYLNIQLEKAQRGTLVGHG
jgi:hypothetical protein